MWVARVDQGYVFGDLTATAVETLKGVPMLLESTDPRVRARLLPETYDEDDDEQQWQQHAVPELERLFASRAQVVQRDLATLQPMPESKNSLLLIPDEHTNAWLAALNAARLALYVLNEMTAEHLEESGFLTGTPKQQEAALRISMLAEVQAVLLGEYAFEGAEDDDEAPGDDPLDAVGGDDVALDDEDPADEDPADEDPADEDPDDEDPDDEDPAG